LVEILANIFKTLIDKNHILKMYKLLISFINFGIESMKIKKVNMEFNGLKILPNKV